MHHVAHADAQRQKRGLESGNAVSGGSEIVDQTAAFDLQQARERFRLDGPVQIGGAGIALDHRRRYAKTSAGNVHLTRADEFLEDRFKRIIPRTWKRLLPDDRAGVAPIRFQKGYIGFRAAYVSSQNH